LEDELSSPTPCRDRDKAIYRRTAIYACAAINRHVMGASGSSAILTASTPREGIAAKLPQITILQLIYQQKAYEGHAKDYEFSGTSMPEHWQSGYENTKRTLKNREWLKMPEDGIGIVVHDVHREHDR
jgi:NTE family protein